MRIGIIGHAADKFTPETEKEAKQIIKSLLEDAKSKGETILISGHCHLGGVDIFAEEEAIRQNIPMELKIPKTLSWGAKYGFRARNIDIAKCSDTLHIIAVAKYRDDYRGSRFKTCYHCKNGKGTLVPHIKGGACWTALRAQEMGKNVVWHIIGVPDL